LVGNTFRSQETVKLFLDADPRDASRTGPAVAVTAESNVFDSRDAILKITKNRDLKLDLLRK
jgi:hypothetical protein